MPEAIDASVLMTDDILNECLRPLGSHAQRMKSWMTMQKPIAITNISYLVTLIFGNTIQVSRRIMT
ncbi:MAG: hypothetical protein CMH58_02220 [Myxococcales bacterium]|nr:hypothetical protein [Myxococcales bacterium]